MQMDEPKNPYLPKPIGVSVGIFFFGSIGVLCFSVFCIVRTWFKDIYSPRRGLKTGRPPKLSKGYFSWISTVWSVPETFILATVGLDGVMLLRFFKISTYMFLVLSVVGLCTIVPVNYYADRPKYGPGNPYDELAALKELTIENVPFNSPWLRVHLLFTWIFSFLAYGFLVAHYRSHVSLKHQYTEFVLKRTKLSKIEHRSLMVFGIPRELRHEVDLAAYFEGLGIGSVENVVICRKWMKLRYAVKQRAYYLQQLERVYHQVRQGSGRLYARPETLSTSFSDSTDDSGDAFMTLGGGRRNLDLSAPLLPSSSSSFTLSSSDNASLAEIFNYLDAIDQRMRPTHRVGFLGMFGQRVDSANFYGTAFKEWDAKVHYLRRFPERSPATAVGIVTFDSPQSAIIASQVILHRRPFACMSKMAPEPRDIFWPNLSSRSADTSFKLIRSILMNSISFLLTFTSTFFILFVIAPLISIPDLEHYPVLKDIFDWLGPNSKDFIQQVVSISLFTGFTSSLPVILSYISELQGLEAVSWIEMSVFAKYFFYLVFNVLLFVVGQTIWNSLGASSNIGNILDIIGSSMPKSSSSIIGYVLIQSLAINPAQLLLAGPLLLTWLTRNAPWSRTSPREVSDAYYPSLLTSLHYGITYTPPVVILVVGLTYSIISPLILPFCAMYFAIAYFVHKYLLLYVHIPRYESSSSLTPLVVRRCLVGVFIMQLTMMGVLAIKYGGSSGRDKVEGLESPGWSAYAQMVIGVLPLLVMTAGVWGWLGAGYDKLVNVAPMDVVGKAVRDSTRGSDWDQGRDGSLLRSRVLRPGRPIRDERYGPGAKVQAASGSDYAGGDDEISGFVGGGSGVGRRRVEMGLELESQQRGLRHFPSESSMPPPSPVRVTGGFGLGIDSAGQSPAKRFNPVSRLKDSFFSINPSMDTSLLDEVAMAENSSSNTPQDASDDEDEHRLFSGESVIKSPLLSRFTSSSSSSPVRSPRSSNRQDLARNQHSHSHVVVDDNVEQQEADLHSNISDMDDAMTPNVVAISSKTLEPPSTRVPGILDAPFGSSMLPEGDETDMIFLQQHAITDNPTTDLQLHTYIHPALIGRLPVAWLGDTVPTRLRESREEQVRNQRVLFQRIVGLQKASVAVIGGGGSVTEDSVGGTGGIRDGGADDGDGEDDLLGVGSNNAHRRLGGLLTGVVSFFDGIASWAHLQMSS